MTADAPRGTAALWNSPIATRQIEGAVVGGGGGGAKLRAPAVRGKAQGAGHGGGARSKDSGGDLALGY